MLHTYPQTLDDKGSQGRLFRQGLPLGFQYKGIRKVECCSHADILLFMQMYVKGLAPQPYLDIFSFFVLKLPSPS